MRLPYKSSVAKAQEIFRWRAALSEKTLNACEFYER
jgi:hypothetical protein